MSSDWTTWLKQNRTPAGNCLAPPAVVRLEQRITPATESYTNVLGAPLAIADGSGNGDNGTSGAPTVNAITVSSSVITNVTDVNVRLRLNHTWQGDLVVTLSDGTNTSLLVNRVGRTGITVGSGFDDFGSGVDPNIVYLTLDDQAATNVHVAPQANNLSGSFRPDNTSNNSGMTPQPIAPTPLSVLNGGSANRTYTLTIRDYASGDTGALIAWGLDITGDGIPTVTGTTGADTILVRRDGANYAVDVTTGMTTTTQSIPGSSTSLVVDGLGGNDTITVNPDVTLPTSLIGGTGNDTITGGSGNDTVQGGSGADVLNGGAGNDTLDYSTDTAGVNINLTFNTSAGGDAGGDSISGFENVNGGSGNDFLFGDNLSTGNVLNGNGGDDQIYGLDGNDVLTGGAGNDNIDCGKGNDLADGGDGNDQMFGRGGNDSMIGGAGNDLMQGNEGSDRMNGGLGADSMNAGTGSDTFVINFSEAMGTGGSSDTYFGGVESDTFEVRGVYMLSGMTKVFDPAKVSAMDAYFLAAQTAGRTDLDTNIDSLAYTLLDEAPL